VTVSASRGGGQPFPAGVKPQPQSNKYRHVVCEKLKIEILDRRQFTETHIATERLNERYTELIQIKTTAKKRLLNRKKTLDHAGKINNDESELRHRLQTDDYIRVTIYRPI